MLYVTIVCFKFAINPFGIVTVSSQPLLSKILPLSASISNSCLICYWLTGSSTTARSDYIATYPGDRFPLMVWSVAPLAVSLVSTRDGQFRSPQLRVVSGNLLGFFDASSSTFRLRAWVCGVSGKSFKLLPCRTSQNLPATIWSRAL
jgi:hypothetical protein